MPKTRVLIVEDEQDIAGLIKHTLERAENLAQRMRDSQARGLALTVRSTATFLRGTFRESVRVCTEAERVLATECTDVDWEIGNTRVF